MSSNDEDLEEKTKWPFMAIIALGIIVLMTVVMSGECNVTVHIEITNDAGK